SLPKAFQIKSCRASESFSCLAKHTSCTPCPSNKYLFVVVIMILLPGPNHSRFPANICNCTSVSTSSRIIRTFWRHSLLLIAWIPLCTFQASFSLLNFLLYRSTCSCKAAKPYDLE
ncbi:hypothetical protein I3843_16G016900, partial [Carya illinoinensis]